MIRFEFLNGYNIYYFPNSNSWSGIDKGYEKISLPKIYAIVSKHGLLKEVESMSLECTSEDIKNTTEGSTMHDKKGIDK